MSIKNKINILKKTIDIRYTMIYNVIRGWETKIMNLAKASGKLVGYEKNN